MAIFVRKLKTSRTLVYQKLIHRHFIFGFTSKKTKQLVVEEANNNNNNNSVSTLNTSFETQLYKTQGSVLSKDLIISEIENPKGVESATNGDWIVIWNEQQMEVIETNESTSKATQVLNILKNKPSETIVKVSCHPYSNSSICVLTTEHMYIVDLIHIFCETLATARKGYHCGLLLRICARYVFDECSGTYLGGFPNHSTSCEIPKHLFIEWDQSDHRHSHSRRSGLKEWIDTCFKEGEGEEEQEQEQQQHTHKRWSKEPRIRYNARKAHIGDEYARNGKRLASSAKTLSTEKPKQHIEAMWIPQEIVNEEESSRLLRNDPSNTWIAIHCWYDTPNNNNSVNHPIRIARIGPQGITILCQFDNPIPEWEDEKKVYDSICIETLRFDDADDDDNNGSGGGGDGGDGGDGDGQSNVALWKIKGLQMMPHRIAKRQSLTLGWLVSHPESYAYLCHITLPSLDQFDSKEDADDRVEALLTYHQSTVQWCHVKHIVDMCSLDGVVASLIGDGVVRCDYWHTLFPTNAETTTGARMFALTPMTAAEEKKSLDERERDKDKNKNQEKDNADPDVKRRSNEFGTTLNSISKSLLKPLTNGTSMPSGNDDLLRWYCTEQQQLMMDKIDSIRSSYNSVLQHWEQIESDCQHIVEPAIATLKLNLNVLRENEKRLVEEFHKVALFQRELQTIFETIDAKFQSLKSHVEKSNQEREMEQYLQNCQKDIRLITSFLDNQQSESTKKKRFTEELMEILSINEMEQEGLHELITQRLNKQSRILFAMLKNLEKVGKGCTK
ncbi:hypothetical protein RFI_14540 [Reticulomyxa filosa]|uniref:RRN6 beta-propeller domain-containing protein n=1 Tax=Reticulomyxa filosa TaxID=46433 RepID=X6NA62_RETFI|nr:hypothetical protein RFI_14540 [Reticulomyxa filosa]|eukprot:ETO22654.1 hypothetical protein RFI_14540 [Reticulomyxa filosa]